MISAGKKIYLCRPNLEKIAVLNGVRTDTAEYGEHLREFSTLSFEVDRFIVINGQYVESNGYEQLGVYMYLLLEGVGYFQMQHPAVDYDGSREYKSITAYSIDKEFEDTDWVGLKINTGYDDSLEKLIDGNLDDLGFAKRFITFLNPQYPELSLLHIILTKMPGWTVDPNDIDRALWGVKLSIEEDNINLYALLTSVIAPKAECVFTFDILNRKIKAVSKDNLDYDTNIFIGFRNLAKSVHIEVAEDSVYTRINCSGADGLSFEDCNYGESRIFDLSYFLCEPYMRQELADKVNVWIQWRNANRDAYIGYATSSADLQEKIDTIKYRVPDDGCDYDQYDKMDEETLREELKYYNGLITSLQISVDTNPRYTEDGTYIPWTHDEDIYVDHERYLDLLYKQANGYGGYYTYKEILEYIIPNINIALENLGVPEDDKKDFLKEFETNWSLYGIKELEARKADYENRLDVLKEYEKEWDALTDEEKAKYSGGSSEYNIGHNEYVEIKGYLGDESTPDTLLYQLNALNNELIEVENLLKSVNDERAALVSKANISSPIHGFTQEEIVTVNTLFHDTDYTNNNILATSIDTAVTKIDKQRELYDDSVDKLSELCQPQMSFQVNIENLLRLEAFKEWHDDFKLLHFIRVGIRDDYSVKLRVIGLTYNPCEYSSEIQVEFSNMITSRNGRSDLTDVLQTETGKSNKNGISLGTGNSDADKEYIDRLLTLMTSNKIFTNAVGGLIGGGSGGYGSSGGISSGSLVIDEGQIKKIMADYGRFIEIDVKNIRGDTADFNKLFATYIDSEFIATGILNADQATFNSVSTKILESSALNSDVANIKNVLLGDAGVGDLQSINLTSKNVTIDDAVIKDLIASKISVGDLLTQSATAELITLISSDGKPSIAFQNSTQQFYDSNGNIRVQIGQDGNGDFNFIVRGEDGSTALFDSTGIKKEGIPDNTIVNGMIEDATIAKEKLGFRVVEANEQGGIDITDIYDGNGGKFGVEYNTFKETVTGDISALEGVIDKSSFALYVYTTSGAIFDFRSGQTTLYARLYKQGEDVTDLYPDSCFVWSRTSADSAGDMYWNEQHVNGTKTLRITKQDVFRGASFGCSFIVDGDVVAQSN